jgi:hypothetical protein
MCKQPSSLDLISKEAKDKQVAVTNPQVSGDTPMINLIASMILTIGLP